MPSPTAAATLLERVHRLELVARRNAAGLLAGDYLTAVRGQGMVFHEAHKYVLGQPARMIDWNVTARLGEPYVKVHLEERQREVLIALDVSPSMHSGLQERSKLEHAVELAATLAWSAIAAGDRLGHVIFADESLADSRPRGGRTQLFRVLRSFLDHTRPWTRPVAASDPRAAIHAIERYRRGRFVVFLISDFIDHDVPEDLKYLRPRHDVSLLHVYDPLEYAAASPVRLHGFSPEASASASASTWLPLGGGESLAEITGFLRQEGGRLRLAVESFATDEPVALALARFFHNKRCLCRRR